MTTPRHARSRRLEALLFLAVGGVAFVVQFVLLNLLVSLDVAALPANALAITTSVLVAYIGNRRLSFAHRRHARIHREAVAFVVVNAVTLLLSEALLGTAYLSHNDHDRVVLNALDVVGIALGTVLRFWAYRRFVFTATAGDEGERAGDDARRSGPLRPPHQHAGRQLVTTDATSRPVAAHRAP